MIEEERELCYPFQSLLYVKEVLSIVNMSMQGKLGTASWTQISIPENNYMRQTNLPKVYCFL